MMSKRMPSREPIAMRLPLEMVKTLRAVREKRGIPVTTQLEFAYRDWLAKEGLTASGELRKRRKRAHE